MIESLRTLATPSGFLGGGGGGGEVQKYSCKGLCKGKSNETTYENIVSRYQTLVSSLPRVTVFLHRRPKTKNYNWVCPDRGQPSNNARLKHK